MEVDQILGSDRASAIPNWSQAADASADTAFLWPDQWGRVTGKGTRGEDGVMEQGKGM